MFPTPRPAPSPVFPTTPPLHPPPPPARTGHDYDNWIRGLGLLMHKSPPSPEKGAMRVSRGGVPERLGVGLDFLAEVKALEVSGRWEKGEGHGEGGEGDLL